MTDKKHLPLEGRKILVVDDEPDALMFIATILEDHGATTVHASNGDEALELARTQKLDLMTLDLNMPGKSGIDVFVELRADPKLEELPVCIITGRPEMRRLIYERLAGTAPEGYMDKPVNELTLIRNVRRILELSEQREVSESA